MGISYEFDLGTSTKIKSTLRVQGLSRIRLTRIIAEATQARQGGEGKKVGKR